MTQPDPDVALKQWQRYMLAHAVDEPGQRLVTLREAQDASKAFYWWRSVATSALNALADGDRDCLAGVFVMAQVDGGWNRRRGRHKVKARMVRGYEKVWCSCGAVLNIGPIEAGMLEAVDEAVRQHLAEGG